jgi:hypothetical protein
MARASQGPFGNHAGGVMTAAATASPTGRQASGNLIFAAILDPAQFHDIWGGGGLSPERELAAAVLAAAVTDLQKYRYARRRRRQRLYWQAYQWVASADRQWPFSFVNICETLRLAPDALRQRLLNPAAGELAQAA